MTKSFDLIDDNAWIPVVTRDFSTIELPLRELLYRAHELTAIRDTLPTVEFGLYRFINALILDIYDFKPGELNRYAGVIDKGIFDKQLIDSYFNQWADRFDLFHSKYPFFQTGGMENEQDKPFAGMIHPYPSGTNTIHFHHRNEKEFGVCPNVAARLLTTIAPFMTAGGAGLAPSINGAPPWYVLIRGKNLFETICLNTFVLPLEEASDDTPPAWKNTRKPGNDRRTSTSLREALTWRPRCIQLIAGEGGICSLTGKHTDTLVTNMKFIAGDSCDFSWRDPNVAYRFNKDARLVLRPQEGRMVWRDSGALAFLQENDFEEKRNARPLVIDQYTKCVQDGILPKRNELRLSAYAVRTDLKMKIFEWYKEDLSLPFPLVLDSKLHTLAQIEMDKADDVAYCIKSSIKKAFSEKSGSSKAFDALVSDAITQYWNTLEAGYKELLKSLSETNDNSERGIATEIWRSHVKSVSGKILDEAIQDYDTDAEVIRCAVEAHKMFYRMLALIYMSEEEKEKLRERRKQQKAKKEAIQ